MLLNLTSARELDNRTVNKAQWLFQRDLSQCYEPILYHHKHISLAYKALNDITSL